MYSKGWIDCVHASFNQPRTRSLLTVTQRQHRWSPDSHPPGRTSSSSRARRSLPDNAASQPTKRCFHAPLAALSALSLGAGVLWAGGRASRLFHVLLSRRRPVPHTHTQPMAPCQPEVRPPCSATLAVRGAGHDQLPHMPHILRQHAVAMAQGLCDCRLWCGPGGQRLSADAACHARRTAAPRTPQSKVGSACAPRSTRCRRAPAHVAATHVSGVCGACHKVPPSQHSKQAVLRLTTHD